MAGCALAAAAIPARWHARQRDQHGHRLQSSGCVGQGRAVGREAFADDVLARPNVSHVIVLEGINDISYEHASPQQLIAAYQDLIARAHARDIKVYSAGLLIRCWRRS